MGTSGDYDGLDRFGRIVDLRHVDFDGGTTNLVYLNYTRDRNGNPTLVKDSTDRDFRSAKHTFDNLNRLANTDTGTVAGTAVAGTKSGADYVMDLLGCHEAPKTGHV
jgi:hypothetical protein